MTNESDLYINLLDGHLHRMIQGLRQFNAECWKWSPSSAAPTALILAEHTLQWLRSDRMHIEQPDAEFHDDIPAAAQTGAELIAELEAEQANWRTLLARLSADHMQAARRQFNHPEAGNQNVRWFVLNALQNVIYNHGQLVVLYLALSAPGAAACAPPLPQVYYDQLRQGWGRGAEAA